MVVKKTVQRRKDRNLKLTIGDKQILHAIEPIVEAIAKLFGSNCEVVLHSMEDFQHSIIKIENGHVTDRTIGAPLTNFAVEILKNVDLLKNDVTESYYSETNDGRKLKSITTLIRNDSGNPIGFLCINFDMSVPLINLINEFSPAQKSGSKNIHEDFVSSAEDLIKKSLKKAISATKNQKRVSSNEKNKLIVFQLFGKGIFDIKGAVELVAQEIGVSRYTVYNYLKEAKARQMGGFLEA